MFGIKGKLLILLLGFSLSSLSVYSQAAKPPNLVLMDYQQFHFGYSVGINSMAFSIIPTDGYHVELKQWPGININLVTNYRLGKNLDLRALPGIQFNQRDLTITDNTNAPKPQDWKIESIYFELPINLKYRADRVNNYAPYLIAGVNPRIDFLGSELNGLDPGPRMLQAFDVYPELGFGIDFYLQNVKVAAELKFSVSLINSYYNPLLDVEDVSLASDYANYVYGVEKVTSRMVILSIHIE